MYYGLHDGIMGCMTGLDIPWVERCLFRGHDRHLLGCMLSAGLARFGARRCLVV